MCKSAQPLPTSSPQSTSGALHGLGSYTPPHPPPRDPRPGRLDQPGWCCPPTQSSAAPPSVPVPVPVPVPVSSASFHPPDGASRHPPVNTTAPQRKGHTKRRKFAFTLTRTRKASFEIWCTLSHACGRDFLTHTNCAGDPPHTLDALRVTPKRWCVPRSGRAGVRRRPSFRFAARQPSRPGKGCG